jgi:hypothetical protein
VVPQLSVALAACLSPLRCCQGNEKNKTREETNDEETLPLGEFRQNPELDHAPQKQVQNTQANRARSAHFVESEQHLMLPFSAADLVFAVMRARDVTFAAALTAAEL